MSNHLYLLKNIVTLPQIKAEIMFVNKEEDDQITNEWIKFGMRLGVSAALHPFDYAKCLIQVNIVFVYLYKM